jgi:hypothetical protein
MRVGRTSLRRLARVEFISAACAPLGVLAFWGGLWMAARRYPSEYDWRYMTISSLLYVDRNPDGFQWAWGGLMLCALGGLCWTAVLVRDWKEKGAGRRPIGISALGLGYTCMVCALLPAHLLWIPKGHEMLALSAFLGLCIGVVSLTFRAADGNIRLRTRSLPGGSRLYAGVLAGGALSPILLAALASAYVSYALPELPWVGMQWRARGVPAFLSFAFWEWITCVVFSAYTVSLCLSRGNRRTPRRHARRISLAQTRSG